MRLSLSKLRRRHQEAFAKQYIEGAERDGKKVTESEIWAFNAGFKKGIKFQANIGKYWQEAWAELSLLEKEHRQQAIAHKRNLQKVSEWTNKLRQEGRVSIEELKQVFRPHKEVLKEVRGKKALRKDGVKR